MPKLTSCSAVVLLVKDKLQTDSAETRQKPKSSASAVS